MKPLLLDTHVFLWMISEPEKLSKTAVSLITDPRQTLLLSTVSLWEISIKYQIGKLPLPRAPHLYIPKQLSKNGVQVLPIDMQHSLYIHALPFHHKDPFDRMIICQAHCEKMPIVSQDSAFCEYEVSVLW